MAFVAYCLWIIGCVVVGRKDIRTSRKSSDGDDSTSSGMELCALMPEIHSSQEGDAE